MQKQVCPTTVITGDATDITQSSAAIVGNSFSRFFGTINFVSIQYSVSPDFIPATTVYGTIGSPFSVDLTELQPSTTYYYQAVVSTICGLFFGAVRSFTTLQPVPTPEVFTGDAENITGTSASIVNNAYSGILELINFVGIQYSTSSSMGSPTTVSGTIGSPFSVILTGLQPSTTYYYRAVVNTVSGLFLGAVKSFTTQPVPTPVVITGDAVSITSSSAIIINNTYSGFLETINIVGIQYSTSPSMSSSTMVYGTIGSPFAVNLTGLQPGTTYYYRAGVNTASGSYYGEVKSFTTPNRA